MPDFTLEDARAALEQYGGVLRYGGHAQYKSACCAMELRAVLRGEEWNDGRDNTALAARIFNDAFLSDQPRTEACLPLVLLADETAPGWEGRYKEAAVRVLIPLVLRQASRYLSVSQRGQSKDAKRLQIQARRCARQGTALSARRAVDLLVEINAPYDLYSVVRWISEAADYADATDGAVICNVSNAACRSYFPRTLGPALLIAAHRSEKPWEDPEVLRIVAEAQKEKK